MPIPDKLARFRNGQGFTGPAPYQSDAAGLQMPPEVVALITSMLMPQIPKGIGQAIEQAPGRLGNEAGAIFPQGEIPKLTSWDMAKEFENVAPESEKQWVRNMNNYDMHAENMDWPRVLRDKWAMLKNYQGN